LRRLLLGLVATLIPVGALAGQAPAPAATATPVARAALPVLASWAAHGEIYAGGDPRLLPLGRARRQAAEAFRLIASGRLPGEALCRPEQCVAGSDPLLCRIVRELPPREREACARFLTDEAAVLARLAGDAGAPLALSEVPL